jgi:hypothetical protein
MGVTDAGNHVAALQCITPSINADSVQMPALNGQLTMTNCFSCMPWQAKQEVWEVRCM